MTQMSYKYGSPDSAVTKTTSSYTYTIPADCSGGITAGITRSNSWSNISEQFVPKEEVEELKKQFALLEETVDMMEQNIDYLTDKLKTLEVDILSKEAKINELNNRMLVMEAKNSFLESDNLKRKNEIYESRFRLGKIEEYYKNVEGRTLSNELYIQEMLKEKETEENGKKPNGTSSNDK